MLEICYVLAALGHSVTIHSWPYGPSWRRPITACAAGKSWLDSIISRWQWKEYIWVEIQAGDPIDYCSSSSYWSRVWKECNNNIWTLSRELGPKGSANVVQKQHLLFYDLKDAVSNYALLLSPSFFFGKKAYLELGKRAYESRFSRYICSK